MKDKIIDGVFGQQGYYLGLNLSENELDTIRKEIREQWLGRIAKLDSNVADRAKNLEMFDYHLISAALQHSSIWPKAERVLPCKSVKKIRTMRFMQQLEKAFGPFTVSDEEDLGREEMYWRLVRPHEASDVGPVHADSWFWELGHGVMPKNKIRIKVWIAIFVESGMSGLRVVPHSHLKQWSYHGEQKHGFIKPVIDEEEHELALELLPLQPAEMIIFNDALLHGGGVTEGNRTRVSLEFTIFADKLRIEKSMVQDNKIRQKV